jgi:acyl-[acyl-carrier-protein]-phospholipid O-acyltransferase / long-chain-fatty-acid--[acyl-carrier-protein] ligase
MNSSKKKSFWALIVTQFTGAFNDNVLKTLTTLLIAYQFAKGDVARSNSLVSLTGAVFVMPFLIFSMIAGRVADRVGKPRVALLTKYWELLVVAVAVIGLQIESLPLLLIALFLISMQATFFSPAKYGVLPEMMGENELSEANAYLNLFTFTSILGGTLISAFLVDHLHLASVVMIGASLMGLGAAHLIAPIPAAKQSEPLAWNPVNDLMANWRLVKPDQALRHCMVAVNYFWLIGAILQLNIFLYTSQMMKLSEEMSGGLLAAVMVGIALGSWLCGKLSRGTVELGFVGLGAVGMSLFGIDLMWAHENIYRAAIDFFMMGMSAGFYEVPLMAFLQWRSPPAERGRIMATVNFLSFVAILAASAVLWLLGNVLHLNPAQVFFTLGTLSLTGVVLILWRNPGARLWRKEGGV